MDLPWLYRPAWFLQRSAIEKRAGQPALVSSSAVWPRREMPFSQKCSIRSSCARTLTSDPDLEAETRFSPRSIQDGSFLGEGVCSVEGGSGSLPRLPWRGGRGGGGLVAPSICHLSPGGAGYNVLPWSDLMIRVVGPWNPLLMWAGPGPPNLSYIHIRLIDEALFQSSYRPFWCGRHSRFDFLIKERLRIINPFYAKSTVM